MARKKSNQAMQQQRKKQPRKRNPQRLSPSKDIAPYVHMLADPCTSPLAPGIYGDSYGLTARFRTSSFNTSTGNAGYCLWVPSFHASSDNMRFNLYGFTVATGDLRPLNTTATPLGNGAVWALGGGGFSLPDPVGAFVEGEVAEAARLISACMRLTYTGALSGASGQVAYISGLDPVALLTGGAGHLPPSVEELFNLATKVERFSVDTHEIIFSDYVNNTDLYAGDVGCWEKGIPASYPTTTTTTNTARHPMAFGFAWDFVTSNSVLKLEFVKNVEWKPRPMSGLVQPVQTDHGPSLIKRVLTYLDKYHPGWSTTIAGIGRDMLLGDNPTINAFVQMAQAGTTGLRRLRGAH